MNDDARPDPDALLAQVREEDEASKGGRLSIFLGMCPGVEKTYVMLQASQQLVREGRGVLVAVGETELGSILGRADEIDRVDLPPAQLLKRLAEGKVYMGERAMTAADNFFKEGHLIALREMALRFTAESVDRDLGDMMRRRRIHG